MDQGSEVSNMGSPNKTHTYEARIKMEDKIIFKTTGENLDKLKVILSDRCELEHSGVEGEIIELATGKIVYKFHKQTIIDK